MKVLLINGSPNKNGCTYTALSEVAKQLELNGIETEIFHIGVKPVRGCIGCGACSKNNHRCIFNDDTLNAGLEKAANADGFVFGSPVYYASPNGSMISFLDRFFYAGNGAGIFAHKPGAAIVSARRAGTTASLDVLNKYFTFANMPIVSSNYWNMVHGNTPTEVEQDKEGLQIMRRIGDNMVWLLKCIEAGKQAGIQTPEAEAKIKTNFIR